ncbi:MAG: hypothetical protein N0E55_17220 [Candidatus Thiodiazotropha taylori]|nr:hypothetical protein [Candidatus Thiodiazotropha taylori]
MGLDLSKKNKQSRCVERRLNITDGQQVMQQAASVEKQKAFAVSVSGSTLIRSFCFTDWKSLPTDSIRAATGGEHVE